MQKSKQIKVAVTVKSTFVDENVFQYICQQIVVFWFVVINVSENTEHPK